MTIWTILTFLFGAAVIYLLLRTVYLLAEIRSGLTYLGELSRSDGNARNELLDHVSSCSATADRIESKLEDIDSTLTNIDVNTPA